MVRDRLIRLGASQLVIVGAGLLMVLCVAYLVEGPSLEDVYARAFSLPRMEERWGFRLGAIRVDRDGGEYQGIVSLTPNGRLARLGLRVHDKPFSAEGAAYLEFYQALLAIERGERTAFEVVNLDDWAAGRNRQAFRTIQIPPAR